MNPIGANTWIWVSPLTDERLDILAPKVAGWGFDLIELPIENPSDWDPGHAAETLAENGLGATVCAAMAPGRELASADRATIEATRDYIRHCIDAAATVAGHGNGVVAGPLYASVGRTWRMAAGERAALLDELVESLKILADYAGERDVRLAVEPLNRFETSVINTAEQALEVVEAVDSSACGILLDTFHMNIEERDPEAAIRSVGPRLAHFHACANDRGAPGNDHMNWAAISTALAEVRYTGPVCIESFTSENESIATAAAIWRPLAPTQDEIATSGLAFLRGVLNEPENQ